MGRQWGASAVDNDFERIREIFLAAVEHHPPDRWDAYLAEACGDDPELRRQVAMLLAAHTEEGSLPRPASSPAFGHAGPERPGPEGPGTVIGPYKLLQQIGEGGMGTVFMAEQDRPVRRRVALKVIKP